MNLLAQTALLVALTSWSMGLSVLARQLQNKLFVRFSVLCGVIFAWSLFFFLEQVFGGGRFYAWHLLSGIWLGPACLSFIRIWIGRLPSDWRGRWSQGAWWLAWASAWALTTVWVFAWLGQREGFGMGPLVSPSLLRDLMYFAPAPVVLQLFLIPVIRGSLPLRENVVFGGALLLLAIATMDHLPWLGHVVPSIGNLLLCIYLILLGQAVRQQKLLDLQLILTRFVLLMFLALVLTSLYLVLVSWVQKNPLLFFLNSFAVSFGIVILLNPIQRWVSVITERLLASRDREWRRRLEESRLEVRSARDLREWEQAVKGGIARALASVELQVVLRGRDFSERPGVAVDEMQARRGSGRLSVLVRPLVDAEIERTSSPVLRDRLQQILQEFQRSGCSAILPIFDDGLKGWVWARLDLGGSGDSRQFRSWRLLREVEQFLDDCGKCLGLLLRVRDESERERLATLGEMAAGLAHEIRNPLGAIQGAVQLLPEGEGAGPWNQVIREEVARLNHVVGQFLVYSRRLELGLSPEPLVGWLSRAVERLNSGLLVSGEVLRVRIVEPELWSSERILVQLDAESLFQVLENLVRNSIQAGATEVNFSLKLPAGSRLVVLEVQDNGRGFPTVDLKRLFVPFFTTHHSGTGLGLSISQRILEAHRGTIDAVAGSAGGACFRIQLPLEGES
ncbi:MAG: hypothetical protein RJB38_791 [Pseudomonadota bacterium]|jgi:signal transduction histidine kinase